MYQYKKKQEKHPKCAVSGARLHGVSEGSSGVPRRNQCGRHAYARPASACRSVGISLFWDSFAVLDDKVLVSCV